MPYVTPQDRDALNFGEIEKLAEQIRNVPSGKLKGATNYVITKIVLQAMLGKGGYTEISDCAAVLRDAACEIERRLMGPREDFAILQNGDLPEYKIQADVTATATNRRVR